MEAGLIDRPLGRASLGGSIYRGSAIPWAVWAICQRRFRSRTVKWTGVGSVLILEMKPSLAAGSSLVLDDTDEIKAGFVKAIGEDERGGKFTK